MPIRTDTTDTTVITDALIALIALIPADGSRISNAEIRAALEQEVDGPISDGQLEEAKNPVVAMGAAEKPRGPGGGFMASCLSPPHPEVLSDPELREHFNHGLCHGFDFDTTMLRIGAMNMLLPGVENPDVSYRDSLSEDGSVSKDSSVEEDNYTLILANPPFAGSLD